MSIVEELRALLVEAQEYQETTKRDMSKTCREYNLDATGALAYLRYRIEHVIARHS